MKTLITKIRPSSKRNEDCTDDYSNCESFYCPNQRLARKTHDTADANERLFAGLCGLLLVVSVTLVAGCSRNGDDTKRRAARFPGFFTVRGAKKDSDSWLLTLAEY